MPCTSQLFGSLKVIPLNLPPKAEIPFTAPWCVFTQPCLSIARAGACSAYQTALSIAGHRKIIESSIPLNETKYAWWWFLPWALVLSPGDPKMTCDPFFCDSLQKLGEALSLLPPNQRDWLLQTFLLEQVLSHHCLCRRPAGFIRLAKAHSLPRGLV